MARIFRSFSAGVLVMGLAVAGCGDDDGGKSSENLSNGSGTTSSSMGNTGTSAAGAATECETEDAITDAATEEVVLTLKEWEIKPSAQPKAGNISFKAENTGKENHEVVIVKADSADGLPKDADGGLDEDKLPDGALIGEIEPFAAGKVCSGTFKMAAGKYVLLCNITETEPSGEKESHLKEGMHTAFVVS